MCEYIIYKSKKWLIYFFYFLFRTRKLLLFLKGFFEWLSVIVGFLLTLGSLDFFSLYVMPINVVEEPHRWGFTFFEVKLVFEPYLPPYGQGSYPSAPHPKPYEYAASIMGNWKVPLDFCSLNENKASEELNVSASWLCMGCREVHIKGKWVRCRFEMFALQFGVCFKVFLDLES